MVNERFLLLLPPPPSPLSSESLKTAFGSSFFSVFRRLRSVRTSESGPAILEVAIACRHFRKHLAAPRSAAFEETQHLVSSLYKLICLIAASESVDVEDSDGIDARVILLAYAKDNEVSAAPDHKSAQGRGNTLGPVLSVDTLVKSKRQWKSVFSIESEEGEELLKQFLVNQTIFPDIERIRGGVVQILQNSDEDFQAEPEKRRHHAVAVGGTFDHLHFGHKLLLTMTAFVLDMPVNPSEESSKKSLTIGITGDELLKNKKYAEYLESWSRRQERADEFLRSIVDFSPPSASQSLKTDEKHDPGPNGHFVHVALPQGVSIKYVEIWDPFGPTITDETISALVVSAETRSGGKAVNDQRAEKNWGLLEVFEVSVLDALVGDQPEVEDTADAFKSKISSTAIRRAHGERMRRGGL